MSDLAQSGAPQSAVGKHRIEALSDGIYAIAMTLLVLELKLAPLPHGATDAALRVALTELVPKVLTWMLSFWVMALFWLSQQRLYRQLAVLDPLLSWLELLLLALVGLLPFSTALIGEHGNLTSAAALYGTHLLLLSLVAWVRTGHALRRPALWEAEPSPVFARALRRRGWVLIACGVAAVLLAFVTPGYNMLAMLPTLLLPLIARR